MTSAPVRDPLAVSTVRTVETSGFPVVHSTINVRGLGVGQIRPSHGSSRGGNHERKEP
jgi:hypothetical protein